MNLSQPTQPDTTYDTPADLRRLALPIYGPSLLFGLGEGAILPVIALSARSFGASVAVAALMVMLINAGSLVFNVPASIICDRYGERLAIVGASALGVAATVLCLVAGNLAVFSVGVFLIGIASSVFLLARQTYLTEAVPAQYRARALSTLGGVMRVGVFIGPFLGAAAMVVWHLRGRTSCASSRSCWPASSGRPCRTYPVTGWPRARHRMPLRRRGSARSCARSGVSSPPSASASCWCPPYANHARRSSRCGPSTWG
ncbi:MFS transporter [Branchiibius cervicis]|uniref:MFS transporter n=1 Tax=Branchiibius cervicis TaxID=908252 RepID=A0ABW2AT47_9MICO